MFFSFPFLNRGKNAKSLSLAPIEVEILPIFHREIATESGTMLPKKAKSFRSIVFLFYRFYFFIAPFAKTFVNFAVKYLHLQKL
jgi:hypothetical protein